MNNKHFFICMLFALTLMACTDENDSAPGRQSGHLYFLPSEGHGWADGNNTTRGGVEAPMLMECSLSGGQPIYLHTEVSPTVSPQLEESMSTVTDSTANSDTRGIRYTGDVFSPSATPDATHPKISSFGVYATSGGSVILNYAQIGSSATTTESYSGSNYNYSWNVNEPEWNSGTGDFYGYAPYFTNSNDNGLSLSTNAGVPTITYTAPSDVTKQLDILTAKHLNVARGNDVELEFTHIMSAIKFKFKHGKGNSNGSWTEKDNFQWSDGLNTYNVTVKTITIENVYTTGTWVVGGDPYNGALWTRTADTKGTFTYSNVNKALTGSSPVDLNPDNEGNVFMMLPQQVPADARIVVNCNLTKVGDGEPSKGMTLATALKETDGTTAKTWLPGYTYTYTLSLSDVAYVFDYNTLTAKNYSSVIYEGTSEENVFIRSYKVDSKGAKTNIIWEIQHYEIDADVTGVGGNTGDVGSWKTGTNGWIHVYDKTGGTYDAANEVTNTHNGANESNTDNEKLFKIEIGSIMTPVIDLSMWNQDQTKRWKGRSASNCYIVAGPGTYRIPLIYGNAWTNGSKNESAYKATTTGNYMLSTFLNCDDAAIQSPFINIDLTNQVDHACLIWEEGDGTSRTNTGGTSSGARDDKYGNNYNVGTVVKVIKAIDTSVTGEDNYNTNNGDYMANANYLQFEIDPNTFNYGNAVVGIRDASNKILWSWHIWITDPSTFLSGQQINIENHDVTFAGTNIGWVDGGQSVAAQTREGRMKLVQSESGKEITINATQLKRRAFTSYFTNVLYQFGRKDPMRGNVNQADMGTDHGAPRGTAGVVPWWNNYGHEATVGELIKNPNSIYGVSIGDLYPSDIVASRNKSYCNLWATNLKHTYQSNLGTWQFNGKTIYDPSPVGYCVPPSRFLISLAEQPYSHGFEEKTHTDNPPIICNYTYDGKTVKFYAGGIRSTTAGFNLHARGFKVPEAALIGGPCLGCYHTSTPYSRDENYQLHLYFYGGNLADELDTHTKELGDHAEALSVMPVLWNGEAVETHDSNE